MDIVNTTVRFIVMAFVFVAGAITLAGPQSGISKNISAQKTEPAKIQKAKLTTSTKKMAIKEPDKTG